MYPAQAPAYARPAPPVEGAPSVTLPVAVQWAGCLFCLLTLSNIWAAPLTGYSLGAEDSAFLRNAYFPAYAVLAGLVAVRPWSMLRLALREIVLVALVAMAFASMAWSIDPAGTFRRSLALAVTVMIGLILAQRWSLRSATELVATTFAIGAVASFLLGAAVPSMGRMQEIFPGAWRGVWLEKNALGGLMSTGALIQLAAAVYSPRRRTLWILAACLCIALVVLSQSKTSLVILATGAAVAGGCLLARRGPVTAVLALWAAVTGAVAAAAVILLAPELIFDALGKDATLTGRTEIWDAAWRQLMSRPQLGFGYGVLWEDAEGRGPAAWIAHDAGFVAGHAHNSWLEVALALGFTGLALFVLYALQVLGRSVRAFFTSEAAIVALPIIVMTLIRSMTEVSLFDYHDITWALFVMAGAMLLKPPPQD
ncbi:MAG: O-antigen ligase family protein [Pseudomonadota bacterium]